MERHALDDPDAYVTLTPTNQAAFDINMEHLVKLPVPEYTFDAVVTGDFDESAYPTESTLRLKAGARVMMLRNDPEKRWVNGTVGIVSDLSRARLRVNIDGSSYDVPRHRWENVRYVFDHQDTVTKAGSRKNEGLLIILAILPKDTRTYIPYGDHELATEMSARRPPPVSSTLPIVCPKLAQLSLKI